MVNCANCPVKSECFVHQNPKGFPNGECPLLEILKERGLHMKY